MQCRKCHNEKITKNGIVRDRQRYKCRACGFNFTQQHAKGWPSDSKMLIVMNYCLGESISELAKQSGASRVSVFRWIEEARESLKTGGEMADWVIEALTDSVGFALTVEKRPKTMKEVSAELLHQIGWWSALFDAKRSEDGTFFADYEAFGWTDKTRAPTDAEFSALVTKRVEEIADTLRKSGWKALSGDG
jgi:transposase-like protein